MSNRKVLVIGKHGQLARAFDVALESSGFEYKMFSSSELNICNRKEIEEAFEKFPADFCINCAAYTAVDMAEEEEEKAYALNSNAVFELGEVCKSNECLLIHFSTDYVYHNGQDYPLREEDVTKPASVYGKSKREGERAIATINYPSLVFRVSWLFAPWGNNFVHTMLKLARSKDSLNVVYDQIGCPTYAPTLARDILKIIKDLPQQEDWEKVKGIYNYTSLGVASWYDFAQKIFYHAGIDQKVEPVTSDQFKTRAERPHYSILNTSKVRATFGLDLRYWEDCVEECVNNIPHLDK